MDKRVGDIAAVEDCPEAGAAFVWNKQNSEKI
jgi:hypothetical protein